MLSQQVFPDTAYAFKDQLDVVLGIKTDEGQHCVDEKQATQL